MKSYQHNAVVDRERQSGRVMHAWEAFLSGERPPRNSLRNVILHSWQRSQSQRVDPRLRKAPLDGDRLDAARRSHRDLVQAAQPVVKDIEVLLRGKDVLVLLCSTTGLILQSHGSGPALDAGQEANITPGGIWQEDICGTNAVGTALATQQAIQVCASEHFCEGIKSWTCAASLVRDPLDGRLLGVLDISYQNESLNDIALPLAVSAAKRIEDILHNRQIYRQNRLLEAYLDRVPQHTRDGVLLLDHRGRLLRHNEHARAALAAQGIKMALRAGAPLDAACPDDAHDRDSHQRPTWMESDWVLPVYLDREQVGSLVFVPLPAARGRRPSEGPPQAADDHRLKGHESVTMQRAIAQGRRVAAVDMPVLLEGETGTGKEVIARSIHAWSSRRDKPFVAVNCGAIPRELLASELFGHNEGAFTGARRGGAPGKFEQADGGTLFLDELGELPPDLQPYLLRVLESNEIVRLGSDVSKTVDVRIIAATNRDLQAAIKASRFREDLYYRFRVSIFLPPLRERDEDIDRYLDQALAEAGAAYGVEKILSSDLRRALRNYRFPGNLRELHNIIEHMVVMSDAHILDTEHLPQYVRGRLDSPVPTGYKLGTIRTAERQAIADALHANDGNRSRAAHTLGISRTTLYRRLRYYGDLSPTPQVAKANTSRGAL